MDEFGAFTLYGRPGWGSVIVEAQLEFLGLAYDYREVGDLFETAGARDALLPHNPLAQLPTLILPNGEVMTESAAITLHLADLTGRDDLVPGAAAPERARFLRWLVFIVANIYPTYTYADDPARFMPEPGAREIFRATVDAYAGRLYGILEQAAGTPWFLGERLSALDIYVGTLTHWRPDQAWFTANTPKLMAIAGNIERLPKLRPVWARNFPPEG
jgi:GST-like protein